MSERRAGRLVGMSDAERDLFRKSVRDFLASAWPSNRYAKNSSDNAAIVCYVNLVGGQDELVFDGGSVVLDERGDLVARAAQFEEELLVCNLDIEGVHQTRLHDPRRRQCTLCSLTSFHFDERGLVRVSYSEPAGDMIPVADRHATFSAGGAPEERRP